MSYKIITLTEYLSEYHLRNRSITTTTLYAAIVDSQRDAAIDSITQLYRQHLTTAET